MLLSLVSGNFHYAVSDCVLNVVTPPINRNSVEVSDYYVVVSFEKIGLGRFHSARLGAAGGRTSQLSE